MPMSHVCQRLVRCQSEVCLQLPRNGPEPMFCSGQTVTVPKCKGSFSHTYHFSRMTSALGNPWHRKFQRRRSRLKLKGSFRRQKRCWFFQGHWALKFAFFVTLLYCKKTLRIGQEIPVTKHAWWDFGHCDRVKTSALHNRDMVKQRQVLER